MTTPRVTDEEIQESINTLAWADYPEVMRAKELLESLLA